MNMEEQKRVVKEVAQKLLTDGATRFALVKYSNSAETALDFTNNYAAFAAAVDALSADANANAYAGLQMAKEVLDARGNAANEANIVIVSARGSNFNVSQVEALSGEIRNGGISIYGLSASGSSDEMKDLCNEVIASGANSIATKLVVRLCASPSYQKVSVEGSLFEKFKQRGNISISGKNTDMSLSAIFEGAEAVYENNRYTIRIPKWYAGESVSLTLHADLCDRRETGVIPVTGELVLKAENLAQVSAAALSVNRMGYRVTYDTGSGTGSVPEDPAIHAEGDTVALKDKTADLKKDGQNFSGWGASGGVNIRDNGFIMPGFDVTLQALWGRAYIQKRTNTVTQEPTRRMRNRGGIGSSNSFYASAYSNNIKSITFLNTNEMPAGAVAVWDITDINFGTAGSVMAAVVTNESDASKYDLYIGARGGVEAPANSLRLFSGFSSLTTVNATSYFDTSNVTDMGRMFCGCSVLATLDVSGWETGNVSDIASMFYDCVSLSDIGTAQLTVANGCSVTDWNKSASSALTAVTVKTVDGTVLYPDTAVFSLYTAVMSALRVDGEQISLSAESAEEPTEESVEGSAAAEEMSSSVHTRSGGAERDSQTVYASVKNGVTEGGKLTAGQKVEYELELQYIGDEGGRSGELVVTDNIPAGMTYNGDASVSSMQRIDGGLGNILGTVTMQPAVSGNTLTFKVTGLSAGAKIVVTYSCNAPAAEPAACTEYINTASVNDSGLTDEADPVRHYMQKKPSAYYDVSYRYSGRAGINIPDGVAVPGRMGVAQGGSVTLPVPAANGWIFNGWRASGTVVSGTYTPTADVTLYGTWTKIPEDEIKYVNINYSFQNAPPEDNAILADIQEEALTRAEQNQTVTLPEIPSVDGYSVTWTGVSADAGGKYNVGTADTINVVGVWTKQKYNVSYRFDGMTPPGAAVPATKAYEWGDTVRLAAMADQGAYTFAGWTGVTMKTDSAFEMPKNDVTLVGRWMAKSIRINPNGGVWSGSADEAICDYTENIGGIARPVMERFTFKEWSESEGDSIFAKMLTAKWNTAVVAEDFSYHILKPELTPDIAKKLADVAAVGADGNPTDAITVNAGQLADIQAARANKQNGDFPLTFTADGEEKTITVTLYGAFTVSAQDYSGTYDRQSHSGTVTVSGLTDYSIKYRTEADGAYTLETEPSYTDAGTYTYYYQVTVEGNETEENQTEEGSVTVSIAPKSLTDDSIAVAVTPGETEYQAGKTITPAVTVKDGDTVLTEGTDYTLSGDLTKTEIGTYTIAVTGKGNYEDRVNLTWEITLTKMSGITVKGYEGSYDGAEHGISITLSGTSEGAVVKYGTSKDNCSLGESPTYREVGEYVVYYEIAKDGYKTEKGSAKVVIHKLGQEAPEVSAANETIKGKADGSIVGVTSAMEYRREGEDVYMAITGTEIEDLSSGTYYVRYQAKGNYSASPDKKVEVGRGRTLAVTLPGETEQKGYRITADRKEAGWHEKVTLTFVLDSGYDPAGTQIAVTNGTLAKINGTSYEITGLEADTEVTVTVTKRDTTAPEIRGVEDHKMYCEAQTVTVTDDNLDTVTVNGTAVTLTDGAYTLAADGTVYTIIATDKAGNVTKVTVTVNDGHTFPKQWTVEKKATEKEPGRQYKKCEVCGIKVYQTIEPTGTAPDDPDAGKIQKEVMVLPGAPDAVLNNSKAELAEVLTPEEKADVNKGVDAKIWLEVSPAGEIAPSDRKKVEKAAEAVVGTGTEVMYFDASLFKQIGDGEQMSISEPGRPISVTIVIPEKIRNKDVLMVRSYRIIRLHEGETDVIEGTYDEKTAEFTFESDRFSTYAICYKDIPKKTKPTPTPAPGGTKRPGTATSTSVPNEDGQTGNQIESRKDLSILLAVGKQKGKNNIKLTWLKYKSASGYEVYWSYCDGKKNYKKVSTVKASGKRAFVHKKLKKDRAYKYYIAAYKMRDGKKKYIAKSPAIHVAMKYEKRTNVKKITVNKAKVTLRPKKKFQIRAKTVLWNRKKKVLKHVAALRYYTGNKKVAAVSKKGRITAKGKGTCTVYVIANNGVAKKIKVKVK